LLTDGDPANVDQPMDGLPMNVGSRPKLDLPTGGLYGAYG